MRLNNPGVTRNGEGLDFTWITPWMAVSNRPEPGDVPELKALGITHVLDISGRTDGITGLQFGFHSCYLPSTDPGEKSLAFWWAGIAHSLAARDEGGKVLVHCSEGGNRSPRMAQAVLVADGNDGPTAEAMVREARPYAAMKGYETEAPGAGLSFHAVLR